MIASANIARRCRALAAVISTAQQPEFSAGADQDDPAGVAEEDVLPVIHNFVVGTTEAKADNEIIALEMDPERRAVQVSPNPIAHGREIWNLSAKGTAIVCCWGAPTSRGLSLCNQGLVVQDEVEGGQGARAAAWDGNGTRVVATHQDGSASVFSIADSALAQSCKFNAPSDHPGYDVSWDPHNQDSFVAAQGVYAHVFDIRTPSQPVVSFEAADGGKVRCVDVNPNRAHVCLAAGDDGSLRFYDARQTSQPIQALHGGHSHWVTRARYNPFHDQLVVTASTDGVVCLWRAASVSSAPLVDFDMDDEDGAVREAKESNHDMLVRSYQDHQDSVYGLAWSAVEAWTFASLSYDGKVIVSNVPSVEKYKILL